MLKIEKQEKKALVERDEIHAIAEEKITPSNAKIQEELANLTKKEKELIVVKHIYQKFGSNKSDIIAYVYDSAESLKKFEPKKKEKKTPGAAA
jgi:ribosomal protein S24E